MWSDPVTNTPSIIQYQFGAWGQYMPGDGEQYCAPTSVVMALYWLYANGFTQLAPGPFVSQDDDDTVNLELIIAGLVNTSSEAGTTQIMQEGMAVYFSACGISPSSQVTYVGYDSPNLQWFASNLTANFAQSPDSIVLADFSVGWYTTDKSSGTLLSGGSHTLCPLQAVTSGDPLYNFALNNAYPTTLENPPAQNPQWVNLAAVPPNLDIQGLPPPSSQYTQIISETKGNGTDWAILWHADAWTISTSALAGGPGYAPALWQIDSQQIINTNGGILPVLAPLAGSGGLMKCGLGTILLTNTNALSGVTSVSGGTLATTLTYGAPFGTGSLTLGGGGALVVPQETTSAVKVQIASGAGATFTLSGGDGELLVQGESPSMVTIGGNNDGATPNLVRTGSATLRLQPSQGMTGLGSGQLVTVAGTGANLPMVSNGIVAPYVLGQDTDSLKSGTFLTYGSEGFIPATTVSSTNVGINGVSPDMVYSVSNGQTIASGTTVQVAALALADGGVIDGDATLQVGSQLAGDIAGVVVNVGTIDAATLAFGASEAVLYAGCGDNVAIDSGLSGTGGLTMTGPGKLQLWGENAASLSGAVTINAGTLIAAGIGATGAGGVTVNSGAELQVNGMVSGSVSVGQSATLTLNGGTVQGDVDIAAIGQSSSDPGGILQGAGTLSGTVQAAGIIQSGPVVGILKFTNTLILPGDSAFYWRLADYVDNSSSAPGVDWNALQMEQPIAIGGSDGLSIFLDFSFLGADPDGGNEFWDSDHTWTIWSFATDQWNGLWWIANGTYCSGDFTYSWDGDTGLNLYLNWKRTAARRTPAERMVAQARVRPTVKR